MKIAKKLGAPLSSVPYLSLKDRVIQGSADIISWAENEGSTVDKGLTPDVEACARIEKRIDEIAGVHVRRYYYSEALVIKAFPLKGYPLIMIGEVLLIRKAG